jgi:CelD/BcsL family acetyltransferase involved in cellulose biosynthesis
MANAQDITAPLATAAQHAAAAADRLSARIAPAPEAITEQWSALEADPQTSFHQSRAWVEAWTKTTGANLNVVSLEHNGVPFAILPLEIEQRGGLSIARFAGTAHSNENTGLIDTKQLAKIGPVSAKQLATALNQGGAFDGHCAVRQDDAENGRAAAVQSGLPRVFHQNPSFQLPLFKDFSEVLAQINGKRRRKKFRVSERRLEAMGGYRHITGDNDAEALAAAGCISRAEAGAADRAGPSERVCRSRNSRLPAHSCDHAQHGRTARTRTSRHRTRRRRSRGPDHFAVAGLTIKDGHVTCQFGSIDETVAADVSAGELLFYLMIEQASSSGHKVFDFGVGDQLYKRSWCPQRTELVDCYVPLNLKGRLAAPLITGMIRLKRTIKTSPALHRIAARLRGLTVQKGKPAADTD